MMPVSDINAVVGGLLRDLAFAQTAQPKMFGYKRAAAAVLALDTPLTELITAEGALSYKKFTGAAELGELVAGDLAALLAEGFGARDSTFNGNRRKIMDIHSRALAGSTRRGVEVTLFAKRSRVAVDSSGRTCALWADNPAR